MIDAHNIIHISSTDGNIDIISIDPFADKQLIIEYDGEIEVIEVIDKGPKGDPGVQGPPGNDGAGKPFTEIVTGALYESTSSISIYNDLHLTGSEYITGYLNVGLTNSVDSKFRVVTSDTGSGDIISFGNESIEFFKLKSDGVIVFAELTGSIPTPAIGGIYFDGNGFFIGI